MQGKNNGSYIANLNRVPVLTVDGSFTIGQSKAIERFVAKQFNLMGDSDLEEAAIDAFCEHIRDIKDANARARTAAGSDDEERKKASEDFMDSTLPHWLSSLEAIASPYGTLAGGASISLADISLYQMTKEYFAQNEQKVDEALANCPKLRQSISKVQEHPGIKKYIANRPQTMF